MAYSMAMRSQMKYKMGKVMREFKSASLHSGSKKGPLVMNKKQAIAIGISEAKKKGGRGK